MMALLVSPLFLPFIAYGQGEGVYKLDADRSTVGLVSVKDGGVEVPGVFKKVSGEFKMVSSAEGDRLLEGKVTVDIDSLQTSNNPTRDHNVRHFFFEVGKTPAYQKASFVVTPGKPIVIGSRAKRATLEGSLTMHGSTRSLSIPVVIERKGNSIHVKSQKPVEIPFAPWKLSKTVKRLMKVCGHKLLQPSATLNFDLSFERQ